MRRIANQEMQWRTPFLASLGLLVLGVIGAFGLAACSRQDWVEGGLYSVEAENGGYSIAKVLKLDPDGVHMRLYSNHFESRPTEIESSTLYMAGIDHKPDETLGIGHLPLRRKSFQDWNPVLIKVEQVKPEELEGYTMWKDAGGGYL